MGACCILGRQRQGSRCPFASLLGGRGSPCLCLGGPRPPGMELTPIHGVCTGWEIERGWEWGKLRPGGNMAVPDHTARALRFPPAFFLAAGKQLPESRPPNWPVCGPLSRLPHLCSRSWGRGGGERTAVPEPSAWGCVTWYHLTCPLWATPPPLCCLSLAWGSAGGEAGAPRPLRALPDGSLAEGSRSSRQTG